MPPAVIRARGTQVSMLGYIADLNLRSDRTIAPTQFKQLNLKVLIATHSFLNRRKHYFL
jgi:hypothetical protein